MTDAPFTVFVVDDDAAVVKAISRLLRSKSFHTLSFTSPREFLAQHDATVPGCAILDVSMPGLNGFELQKALTTGDSHLPIIFVTGKGDIPTSVSAMKAGAVDFLTKPVSSTDLLQAIARAQVIDREARASGAKQAVAQTKIATLTRREREVLTHVIAGRLNKQIAGDLGAALKTIKVHRGRVMQKLGVKSVADLVRMAQAAGIAS